MNYEEEINLSIKEAWKIFGEDAVYLAHEVKGLVVVNSDDVHTIGDEEQILKDLLDIYSSAGGEEITEMILDRFRQENMKIPGFIQ